MLYSAFEVAPKCDAAMSSETLALLNYLGARYGTLSDALACPECVLHSSLTKPVYLLYPLFCMTSLKFHHSATRMWQGASRLCDPIQIKPSIIAQLLHLHKFIVGIEKCIARSLLFGYTLHCAPPNLLLLSFCVPLIQGVRGMCRAVQVAPHSACA